MQIKSFAHIFLQLTLILFISCAKKKPLFEALPSTVTGIDFVNELSDTPQLNILTYLYYYNGAGVAVADFNNDGLDDLYFTGNEVPDRLYLNKGGMQFEEISQQSGIKNDQPWTTGVTTVDINNDGLMDIYVCKVGNFNSISGKNLLYVNQGIKNGLPYFKEEASKYNLDFKGFSTQAAFFDYDLDGDLDMFLLNHSVYPNRTYGNGKKRSEIDAVSGDKLFENKDGKYIDVTSGAGIYQSKIGYGLGVSVSDINNDGYPDIYVGNDFFENDYLYINQKNKTFKEIISNDITRLGHTTHFSMGNAINDLNNDGKMDIISLDMLPEDIYTYKTSGLEYPYQTYEYYLRNGYSPQFMHNNLHLNFDNKSFNEVGFLSGIAATEWSWNPLVADFDNDGFKDIYITNGIKGATNDMDFINFISNESIQKRISKGMSQEDMSLIKELPEKKTVNYFFRNNGDDTFEDVTKKWTEAKPSFSNGAVYADLDNDGDLDIVVNNVGEKAYVLQNNSDLDADGNHYLKISFQGNATNKSGIGTRVDLYSDGKCQSYENILTRGYLSGVSPQLEIGTGKSENIDSLVVIWPSAGYEILKNIKADQKISIDIKNAKGNYYSDYKPPVNSYLKNVDSLIHFRHKDLVSVEFSRDPLIPFASTNLGPDIAVADVNGDQLDDVFIGGGKTQASGLFIQQEDGSFKTEQTSVFDPDAISEDTDQVFFDADNDGDMDLLVVSGGNEFRHGSPLNPRLYINSKGQFVKDTVQFKSTELNASKVKAVDIDNDGDLDLSITANVVPWQFGVTPDQFIFENNGKGVFKNTTDSFAPELKTIGNVQDIIWLDLNGDSYKDAIVVGYWMPVSVFLNDGKRLKLQKDNGLQQSNGWWNCVQVCDFDQDGDLDIVAGNWGLNSRLKASVKEPITLYSNDFDDNGSVEPVVTYFYKDTETTFSSKDELVKQMPFLNKKYLSYSTFARAAFKDIFPKEKMDKAYKKQIFDLASCYFENLGNNTFKKHQLPLMAQISQVNAIAVDDFNGDHFMDLLLVGNNYEISTQLGRLDASHGTLLLNDQNGYFKKVDDPDFDVPGPARDIKKLEVNDSTYYIISINNSSPVFLKMK